MAAFAYRVRPKVPDLRVKFGVAQGARLHYGPAAMEPFKTLDGVAAPLNMINVDTDMIIPKQYLKTIHRTGLGKALFDEMRFNTDGSEKPDFVLNKPAWRKAQILVTGENFGCGSSREHAPWALLDFGIRCVIAASFADIFYNNCFKNGILPIVLPQAEVDKLMDDAERGSNARLSIDLESQEIRGPEPHLAPDPSRRMGSPALRARPQPGYPSRENRLATQWPAPKFRRLAALGL